MSKDRMFFIVLSILVSFAFLFSLYYVKESIDLIGNTNMVHEQECYNELYYRSFIMMLLLISSMFSIFTAIKYKQKDLS